MTDNKEEEEDWILDEWVHRGLRCKVVKQDMGHYCGYVRTNFGPKWNYDDFQGYPHSLVSVNGGLTYGVDEDGWVGFDCGHSRDLCLDESGEPWGDDGITNLNLRRQGSIQACRESDDVFVWEPDDVKEETQHLADQMEAIQKLTEKAAHGIL